MTAPYRHEVRVRYGDCDMQRVVFNAHYLAYCDDAVDTWVRSLFGGDFEAAGFDFMLKKAVVEWQSPARFGEHLSIDVGVARWGNTSFDVGLRGRVRDRDVFHAVITYVSVTPGGTDPVPPPAIVRERLGEAVTV